MSEQLRTTVQPGARATPVELAPLVPALITDAGEPAAWCYAEFYAAIIHNPHARRAYGRAVARS